MPTDTPAPAEPLGTVDALVQLSFAIHRVLSSVGTEHDLSLVQIRLLGVLRGRQAGILELGTYLGLDKSSMSGLVSRAEKRGLVQRTRSPHDGRAVLVSLTDRGAGLVEAGTAEIGRRITALADTLPAGQRAQLARLATALVRAADPGVAPGSVAGGPEAGQ